MDDLPTPIAPGTPAPPFSLQCSRNARFLLDDAAGRPIVLVFYPNDWEPVSEGQLALYQANLLEFERLGAVLAAISTDSVWSHLRFARSLGLSYPLLSDSCPLGAVARAYHVFRERETAAARALFVLDRRGIVSWSRVYPINVNPGLGGILQALEALAERPQCSG
jgi:peroxiredoxin